MPVPLLPSLVVKYGSNILFIISFEIPPPLSLNLIIAFVSFLVVDIWRLACQFLHSQVITKLGTITAIFYSALFRANNIRRRYIFNVYFLCLIKSLMIIPILKLALIKARSHTLMAIVCSFTCQSVVWLLRPHPQCIGYYPN